MIRAGICLAITLAGCGVLEPDWPLADGELAAMSYQHFRLMPGLPIARDLRQAVKLTYLMADDDAHQTRWSLDMLRMMDDLPQTNVHNLVFRDGGDVGDSVLSYIQKGDSDPAKLSNPRSPLAPGVNEVQSNNPQVFSQVLAWTLDHYPGRHKYLQLYTHGAGVSGIGTDSHQTDPSGKPLPKEQSIHAMPVPVFSEALRQGLKGRQLDLIYFRACLMGNVEALYELRGTTRYALASEDTSSSTANSNLTMTRLFESLAARGTDPAELARALSIQAHANRAKLPNGENSGYRTITAVDINRLDELKTAINELALALNQALPSHRAAITQAYDQVPAVRGHDPTDARRDQMRDLWAFTSHLQRLVPQANVQAALVRVRESEQRALLHTRDAFGSASHGLSIWMPIRTEREKWGKFLQEDYSETRFGRDTAWGSFLRAMLSGA